MLLGRIYRFFAEIRRTLDARSFCGALQIPAAPADWREAPSTSSAFAQETRHPHEMDAGLKLLSTCMPLLVLVEALTSGNAGLALVNLLLEEGDNATLYGLWILSCRVHQSNVVCGDQANDVQNLERTLW